MAQAKAAKEAEDAEAEAVARAAAEPYKKFTVFELRAGLTQDVLPPSIHPGTQKPYVWRNPPKAEGLPDLPAELLAIWQGWDAFKPEAEAVCPWAPKLAKAPPAAPKRALVGGKQLPKVIDEFNRCHDIEALLAAHGYSKHGGKWLCPQSSSGLPGITITDDRLYSHHSSDPLANGHKNDALMCIASLSMGAMYRSRQRRQLSYWASTPRVAHHSHQRWVRFPVPHRMRARLRGRCLRWLRAFPAPHQRKARPAPPIPGVGGMRAWVSRRF